MSYSTENSAAYLNHGKIHADVVLTEIVTNAFNMVKSRVKAAGLTPPTSDDILAVAENFYIKAESVWKGRMMGDLPAGNGSISTYDNVNKSYALFIKMGDEKVDEYIKYASTKVHAYDMDGVTRADSTGDNFKLDQSDISGFS